MPAARACGAEYARWRVSRQQTAKANFAERADVSALEAAHPINMSSFVNVNAKVPPQHPVVQGFGRVRERSWAPEQNLLNHERTLQGMKVLRLDEPESI